MEGITEAQQALDQTCPKAARVSAVLAHPAEMPAPQGASASVCLFYSMSSEASSTRRVHGCVSRD